MAEKIAACAVDLASVRAPRDLQYPLPRPLSHARFALRTGTAGGRLQAVDRTREGAIGSQAARNGFAAVRTILDFTER